MRSIFTSIIIIIAMLAMAGNPALAAEKKKSKQKPLAIKITHEKKIAVATEAFKKDFPNAKFSKIEESGIDGLYEITSGPNIFFYSPGAGKLIFGEMLDKAGNNLTAEKRKPLMALAEAEKEKKAEETAKLIDTLPLDKAIKIGSGKNVVVEFTDIDCPYCRKVEGFFNSREDVTRYVFLFPLEQLHPKSAAKSKEVLCAKDSAEAYKAAMEGKLDGKELKGCGDRDKDIEAVLAQYKEAALKMGVSGTPMMWANKKPVNGADTRKLEKYLAEGAGGTADKQEIHSEGKEVTKNDKTK